MATPYRPRTVSPSSRRILLYWLLLLVPTLVVGGAAILLLVRERDRIVRQQAYAEEAGRAAVATRARLVGETVELIVGDVQAGLLDALAAEPPADVDALLARWEAGNPLVATGFRAAASGGFARPDARTAGEHGRGFLRRFQELFGENLPWRSTWAAPAPSSPAEQKISALPLLENAARQEVSRNVAQAQSARRDVQQLLRSASEPSPGSDLAANAAVLDARTAPGADESAAAAAGAPRPASRVAEGLAAFSRESTASIRQRSQQAAPALPIPAPAAKAAALVDRRGWAPVAREGRYHVFGWVQPGGTGEVRGVELNLGALVPRLAGALPADVAEGEGYALRDERGRVLHQAGAVARASEPAVRVPLAATLLPGWEVAGYLPAAGPKGGGGPGFLGLSLLLVAIFVTAILAGGTLLLRQARRSEEEAAQKTSFVGNVSHEFKTPLTTIRLYSELLEQGRVRDEAQRRDYLHTIGRETQRLARLVNNALDFSRLEQGRRRYAREDLDLGAEAGRVLDTHAPRLAEAGLVLRREIPDTPVRLVSDRDAVGQILLNLVDNACKYAAEGGELAVSVAPRPGGGAVVRVADRGPGVPPAHRERIFEKFHRVDDALTAEKTGAGLGLSIARQLARGLGGDLRYAPRPGSGAEFVLELPGAAGASGSDS